MKIAIGCDHIVTDIKDKLRDWLKSEGNEVFDCGTYDNVRTHYPIYGQKVGEKVANQDVDFGIVLCGTGVGITNAAQKVAGTRVALVSDVYSAKKAREDYNCNVIGFGGRIIGIGLIQDMISTFLKTEFNSTPENLERVSRINGLLEESSHKDFQVELQKWENNEYND